MAFPINKIHKAHYVLLNIECGAETLDELTNGFRFNDAVIRNLVIKRNRAITEASQLTKPQEEERVPMADEQSAPQAVAEASTGSQAQTEEAASKSETNDAQTEDATPAAETNEEQTDEQTGAEDAPVEPADGLEQEEDDA